jgi:hypothetical protein
MITIGRIKDFVEKTSEVLRSDKLDLHLFGSPAAARSFAEFDEKHRFAPWLQSKGFGAALIELPDKPEDYLLGNHYEMVRRKRRAALKNGFQFKTVKALDHLPDMMEINRSAPERQGRAIAEFLVDEKQVRAFCEKAGEIHGVFDGRGKMHAYAHCPNLGDICLFSTLMAHQDTVLQGTMYFLITEAVHEAVRIKQRLGHPRWAMYDMYWGALPGLREFKRRLGFRPYRVTWHYRDTASAERAPCAEAQRAG